jgi:tetratricopeptide (TPR) repeat protein
MAMPENEEQPDCITPQRWQRLEAVLQGALEQQSAARAGYLQRACGDDAQLRKEVESLLSFESQAEPAIANAVEGAAALFEGDDPELEEGERLGVYRIVHEIGRGGMGTVYLAERDDEQFHKQVAIKLVKQGMDTAELLHRFRRERQILARLDHPFIARLLDGGSTEDGRPFLVMEYVQGTAITAYCEEHRLDTRERIGLFLKVCSAVQSAHQNLVVHRDLKPGNILVDSQGSPKLLDFGIAKLLGPDEDGDLTLATSGIPLLTPHYASPEQVRGEAITTAADVYTLGVILYELLAGVRPHRLQSFSAAEIARAVCEEEPERPSTAWRKAAARGENRSGPVLKPDELDNIVLMAMQKEPVRRYGSVAEFAADLERYQDGLPVLAREATLAYRAAKFIRRHRTMVAAAVLLIATLAGGVAVSTLEARRAQRRFDEVRRMAHAVLYDIHDAIEDLPGSLKAREVVVKTALQYLDGLSGEAAGDPDLQLELAEAYHRVGDVQGNANQSSLGQSARAAVSYRKSVKIADELARTHPDSTRANLIRMAGRQELGDISALNGDIEASLKLYGEGEEIGESMVHHGQTDPETLHTLAELYGASAREDQDTQRAISSARKSVSIRERLATVQPNNEDLQADLAVSYSALSSVLESANRFDEAIEAGRKDVQIHEALVRAHPLDTHYRHDLMNAYQKIGDAASGSTSAATQRPADYSEAVANYRKAATMAEALAAADPADRRALEERGMALMKLGMTLSPEKDLNSALTALRRAQADFRTLTEEHGEARVLKRLAATYMYVGRRLASTGHTDAAVPNLRESLRITDDVLGKNPKDLLALNYSWRCSQELAKALAARQQRNEALHYSSKAIAAAQAARGTDGANPVTQSFLPQAWSTTGQVHATLAEAPGAPLEQRREDWSQARDSYLKSVEAWERIQAPATGPNDWDAQLAHARVEAKRCAAAAAAIR